MERNLVIKEFFCRECRNWKVPEVVLMGAALAAVVFITVITGGDDLTGIICAATGIMYTLLAGKGKSSCYIFGLINSFLYGLISFQNKIYGDMILNWCYYFPMQIVGLFFWMRNYNPEKGEVKKVSLSKIQQLFFALAVLIAWIVFAFLLSKFNARAPWIDSATTVLSIAAMILSVMRCFEQWICWTLVNGLSIFMWYQVYASSGNSIATLCMWVIFLLCGIVFGVQWYRAGEKK